jgi:rSAM/selenodomain-associated transferase 1
MTRITSANRTLVIMAKAPRAGSVKTRLAGNLSMQEVTELYGCFLEDTLMLAEEIAPVEVAIVCPAPDVEDLSRAVKNAVPVVPQTGKGLAAGLTSVFAVFTDRTRRQVIAFNSDSPHLPACQLETAFEILETRDVVVGPTFDGGYYLVGAKASHAGLFSSAGMGTGTALDELLARASSQGLSVGLTDPFYDIDIAADLSQLTEELRRTPEKAPRTAKWLADWASRSTDRSG